MRSAVVAVALALTMTGGPAAADGTASVTGAAQFDGQRLVIDVVHVGDHVRGVAVYEAAGVHAVISIDCLEITTGGNATTIGGSVYASGTTTDGTRYFVRIIDGGAFTPLTPTSYVGVSVFGWGGTLCDAERIQPVPITDGEFMIVH